ncbi:hypothetical protein NC651_039521 [Populus alba x Populus x berolinensis]|nr:hypothetical protein NC651_039521 [Populus alba x Populus x berolinensis]
MVPSSSEGQSFEGYSDQSSVLSIDETLSLVRSSDRTIWDGPSSSSAQDLRNMEINVSKSEEEVLLANWADELLIERELDKLHRGEYVD